MDHDEVPEAGFVCVVIALPEAATHALQERFSSHTAAGRTQTYSWRCGHERPRPIPRPHLNATGAPPEVTSDGEFSRRHSWGNQRILRPRRWQPASGAGTWEKCYMQAQAHRTGWCIAVGGNEIGSQSAFNCPRGVGWFFKNSEPKREAGKSLGVPSP